MKSLSIADTFKMMKRYKKFPIYGTWSILVSSLMLQLPILIISNYYSLSIVGLFALANRMLQMPMALFNSGLSQVFLKDYLMNYLNRIICKTIMYGLIQVEILF